MIQKSCDYGFNMFVFLTVFSFRLFIQGGAALKILR
jgi:hypothetical protein